MASAFVRLPACGPDHHADALHGRREGFQCAAGWRRTDVPGAGKPRRAHATRNLPELLPWNHAAELPKGPDGTVPGLVCEIPEAGSAAAHYSGRRTVAAAPAT